MPSSPTIRAETPGEIASIRQLHQAAFGRPGEGTLVDDLRRSGSLTLSLVALRDERVVGHIAYSPVTLEARDAPPFALALAPLAVAPDCQRQGIGGALIRQSLDECRCRGHGLVIVLGYPPFYSRFGFEPAGRFGLECPFPAPAADFMLVQLVTGAAHGHRGMVRYCPEFDLL